MTIGFDSAVFTGANPRLTLTGAGVQTPRLSVAATIDGSDIPNLTIDGSNQREILFIRPDTPDPANPVQVVVKGMTLANGRAQGGAGGGNGYGGGGGLGAGGAIYAGSGVALVVEDVNLSNNTAQGGAGGGADANSFGSGGGGLNGGNGVAAASGGGGGGMGRGANGSSTKGGGPTGGSGVSGADPAQNGGDYSGGGSGAGAGSQIGGSGGFGGGGGGGGNGNGSPTAPRGGAGGFGGGGGGGGNNNGGGRYTPGGAGGFGGGAGGGYVVGQGAGTAAQPGFGGGQTGTNFVGGGGAGFGGAIFVEDGGLVTLGGNSSSSGGSAIGGTGSAAGLGLGSGMYLHGTSALNINVAAEKIVTINNVIASDAFAGAIAGNADPAGDGIDKGVIHTGAGVTVLRGINTYAGGTTANGGTVNISADNNLGHNSGGVLLNGGALQFTASFNTARNFELTAANGTIDTQVNNNNLTGVVSGAGALGKTGTGTLTLSGTNTYAGGTVINGGIVEVSADTNLGAATGELSFDGGTLRTTAGLNMNRATVLNAGGATFDVTTGTLAQAGVISGSGPITKSSTGTLILSDTNTYTGTTTVTAGTLLINGNQTAATGQTTVQSGATLGGRGTIGGNVSIAAGATLAPSSGMTPSTLTINGNLVLAATSNLNYQFGAAGVVGGPLNDLVNVNGDLTLAGRLNIAGSSGGTFGAGVYRLMDYTGSLTNNGLTLGTPNADLRVQTSINNQVNLVNTAGTSLSFWDGDAGPKNDGVIQGGNGTWFGSAANDNWTDQTGMINAGFDGALAIFGGAAGTVTVDNSAGAVTASGMQFITDGYSIQGGAIGLTGAQSTLRVGDGSAASAGYTATISSVLTGTSQVVKTDLGTLVLSGTNTYTGGTAINGGILAIDADANLGAAAGALSFDGGTLRTMADLAFIRNITLNAGGGIFDTNGNNLTALASVSGAGALTKIGTGTLTLSNINTYAGGTALNGGVVEVRTDANLGAAAGALSFDGGTLRNASGFDINRATTLNAGGGTFDTQSTLVIRSVVSGEGALTKTGIAILALFGTNTYAGGTALNGGEIEVRADANLGVASSALSFDGGRLRTGAGFNMNRATVLNAGGGTFDVAIGTLAQAGVISGAGALTKSGTGTLTLSGTNTYAGGTTITTGQVIAMNGSALGTGAVTNVAALELNFATDQTFVNVMSGTGALAKTGAGTVTLTGIDSSAGAVSVVNGGLTLSQAGTFTAASYTMAANTTTTIDGSSKLNVAGAFSQNANSTLNTAIGVNNPPIVTANTATLDGTLNITGFNGNLATTASALANNTVTLINTTNGITGNFAAVNIDGAASPVDYVVRTAGKSADNRQYNVGFGLTWFAGPAAGNGIFTLANTADTFDVDVVLSNQTGPFTSGWNGNELTKAGDGTLTLSAVNTYSGATAVNAGTLRTGIVNAFAQSSAVRLASGTTLDLGGFNQIAKQLSGAGNVTLGAGVLTADIATGATLSGVISGTGSLIKTGTGDWTLSGTNIYAGGTAINGGVVAVGADTNLGAATGALSFDGGTLRTTAGLTMNRATMLNAGGGTFDVTTGTLAQAGVISGSGDITKSSTGTLILSGANTYTGTTTVTAGTLMINGNQTGATGQTTVQSGATLGGRGTIGGNVSIAAGATLAPSAETTPSTLTINGNLVLAATSNLNYQFGAAGVVGGPLNDLVNVNGNLTLAGQLNVTASAGGTFGAGVYRLMNYTGSLTNNGLTLGTPNADLRVQTSINNQVNLVNTAGTSLSFWDGDAGPKNDGVIQGGNGIWFGSAANDNWTDQTGMINAGFDGALAIFGGAAGTVTVDNSAGAVTASGMQFITDGYSIQGGAIGLTGAQSMIWVGDGSAASAGYTATISSVLTGTTQVVKTDLGTLILSGINTYTGGTAINGGIVVVGADANLGATAGALSFDDGTLRTTAGLMLARATTLNAGGGTVDTMSFDTTMSGVVSGAGALTKTGTGILTLSSTNTYAGGTAINGGVIEVSADANLGVATGALSFDGGTLRTTAGLNMNRATVLNAGGATFDVTTGILAQAGAISGTGPITKSSTGTLILSGTNTYTGTTTVTAGTLMINGNQTGATGQTTVQSGATLGGRGTIGGNVSIAAGATLAPSSGTTPSTLTINGNLVLAATSNLNYQFGAAGVVGGPLNDLVNVNGNLTLAGQLNVTASAGGTFGAGVYRLMNYTGSLTNNGLTLGTPNADLRVQTSINNQVNLVNTAGTSLSFWDGDAGPKNDGVIQGGNGTWFGSAANDNWTDQTGMINAGFDGALAIFGGAAGTVTVDNSAGAVTASGMQFITDGYVIQGGAIGLTGAQSMIRVGDGSAASAGYTATISSVLTGTSQVVKTELGTLVLSGTNTYTGGTAINGGIVVVGADANLGAAAGALSFDDGTLRITAGLMLARTTTLNAGGGTVDTMSFDTTMSGVVSGAGALTKTGTGILTLSGTNTYAGGTVINGGVVVVDADANLGAATGALSFDGGTLRTTAGLMLARVTTLNAGGGTVDTMSFDTTMSGVVSGAGALTKTGTGILTLSGTNTYAGGTVINGGVVVVGADANLGAAAGALSFNGSTLRTTAGFNMNRATVLNAGGGTFDVMTGTLAQAGAISGAGTLTKTGTGILTLSGTNTYAGGTAINGGVVVVDADANLGAATGALSFDGGTLRTTAGLTMNRATVLNAGGGTFDVTTGTLEQAGVISGSGPITKSSTGTLILSGANTYTGTTTVTAGTLMINGNQTGATGQTTVQSGATLGGHGTIGGNVSIAAGATLAPSSGMTPSTLTINGNLVLAATSNLNYQFGAAGVVGGPLNDLVNVNGNLTLAGQLNVTASAGGTFGAGVYRLMNYTGSLTNNGLTLGTPNADLRVQTSINNQVNLVNTAGTSLSFWDGDAGPKNDGVIQGGNGIWFGSAANDNWTDQTGMINAGFDGALAIFGGAAGTVTVDNSAGAVTASGMQFITDGYSIQGGAIGLTGAQSMIRVGDGTTDGAGYTATISSVLTGTSQVVKADLGTLILSGINTYTGGTAINGGTLAIDADANLGAAAGALSFDGGTLRTTTGLMLARTTTLNAGGGTVDTMSFDTTMSGVVSGAGSLTKTGTGTLTLSGTNTYAGGTAINSGVVEVSADASLGAAAGALSFDGGTLRTTAGLMLARTTTLNAGGGTVDTMSFDTTMSGVVSGAGALTKTGTGILTLSGTNTYAGGTAINGGVVEVSADTNLGAATGALSFDGGTLRTTASFDMSRATALGIGGGTFDVSTGTLTQAGSLSGAGKLVKTGAGMLALTADSTSYKSDVEVNAGILAVDGSLGGAIRIADGARLQGNGRVGDVMNAGTLAPGGTSLGTLTVGSYNGTGSAALILRGDLGADNSPTDKLVVTGSTSGTTTVQFLNRNGMGAQTVNGIQIIEVAGRSDGIFNLKGDYVTKDGQQAVIAGVYAYTLFKGGVSTPADGGWYLRSQNISAGPRFSPTAPVYEGGAQSMQALNSLPSLQQRIGNRYWNDTSHFVADQSNSPSVSGSASSSDTGSSVDKRGVWGRIEGAHSRFQPKTTTTGTDQKINTLIMQAGIDGLISETETGKLIAGITGQYGKAKSSISSQFGDGNADTQGWGLGGTLSWYGDNGFYWDAQAQAMWYNTDMSSSNLRSTLANGNKGFGYALGLEAGRRIEMAPHWSLTPQAQLVWSSVTFDTFKDVFGATIAMDNGDSLNARMGISADYRNAWRDNNGQITQSNVYLIANLHQDFLEGSKINVSGESLNSRNDRTWGSMGTGGTYSWADDKYTIYGEGSISTSLQNFADSYTVKGSVGLRIKW
ncbi:autotransporter-associated beta strand repeat-containing protein [Pseudochrobactrum asaccharolyticum]|uniref:autotransporter-associated beta strand repeat-containing protein n=1 Tax=Pseudochrobactrum asaccharolyticum TaxID=354351 RepID=UPI004042682B